ncbi:MAG: choice-of-anchor D domain-containing protein [Solirubrobacteraceae bacterium]|nr:choice-of-anchor D domain-containing protein [Solirubrobacteraceae bacterium]
MSTAPARRALVALCAALIPLFVLAAPATAEDTAPILQGGSFSPTTLDHHGGQVIITVDAVDDFGIVMAYADVFSSGDSGESVQLIPSGPTSFTGTANIPPNLTDQPKVYGINATVTDGNGGFDSKPIGQITVPAWPSDENQAPVLMNQTASPRSLPAEGGPVTISAIATDDVRVESVYAEVTGTDGSNHTVTLHATALQTYEGTFNAPANTSHEPVSYQVSVIATDDEDAYAQQYAGEVQVAGQPEFDEPPSVFDPVVSPRNLPSAGGDVTLRVSATDLRGITEAWATVTRPGGSTARVDLEPIDGTRFEGTYNAPENTGSTAAEYAIEMTASDDIGQTSSVDGGKVTVAAVAAQPGRIQVSPDWRVFGPIRAGRTTTQSVTVRHAGPASSAPITVTSTASRAPFSVVGGSSLTLNPGESGRVTVAFKPQSAGFVAGSLSVQRADGGQGASVRLTGIALPRW